MVDDDAIERIIACTHQSDVDNPASWIGRHEAQATDGEVDMDEVDLPTGDAFCVAYTPAEDVDITYPEGQPWGDDIRETLRDALYKGSFAGVSTPVRTDCDRLFADGTDLPMYDGELPDGGLLSSDGNTYHMASTVICISPEDWLRVQFSMRYRGSTPPTQEDFADWLTDTSTDTIGEMREAFQAGDQSIPRPFLHLDRDGNVVDRQEGRHRGLAAYYEGVPYMDVYVFADNDSTRGEPEREFFEPPAFPDKEV